MKEKPANVEKINHLLKEHGAPWVTVWYFTCVEVLGDWNITSDVKRISEGAELQWVESGGSCSNWSGRVGMQLGTRRKGQAQQTRATQQQKRLSDWVKRWKTQFYLSPLLPPCIQSEKLKSVTHCTRLRFSNSVKPGHSTFSSYYILIEKWSSARPSVILCLFFCLLIFII